MRGESTKLGYVGGRSPLPPPHYGKPWALVFNGVNEFRFDELGWQEPEQVSGSKEYEGSLSTIVYSLLA